MPRVEVLSVAVGALFLFTLLGFFGVSADNTQYLLGASERINSEFLRNDWFVQATQSFHPFFEVYMAWWLELDQLVVGLFIWYAINLLVLSAAVVALLEYLGVKERLPLAVLLTVGMLLAGVRHGWGMYEILTGQALPAYLAYPPALLSIVLLYKRRYLFSAFALIVTFLIHHGLGALMVLCLLGPMIVTMPRTRQEIIQACSGAALVLAVYLPVVLATVDKDGSEASQFAILFYGRSPQHFAVQFSDFQTHMSSLHIFASSTILAFTITSSDIRLKILSLIGGIAALCALGYLLLEIWYTPVFVRLFPYRAIPILVVLNGCMIVSLLLAGSSTRRDLMTVGLVALSSVCLRYSLPASMLLLGSAAVVRWVIPEFHVAAAREARAAILITCTAGVLALLHSAILYPPAFFPEWPRPAQRMLAGALAEHTPESAIIVVPPWLGGIRISAERAIVVNVKNFPVFGPEMVMWADRMRDVSGIDPRNAKQYLQKGASIWQLYNQGYHFRSLPELVGAAHKYNARFILVSTKSRFHWEAGQTDLPALWSGNGFALYKTPDGIVDRSERKRRVT
jgi:hypothetical protein